MSLQQCNRCDMLVDTDYDTEHVDGYCPYDQEEPEEIPYKCTCNVEGCKNKRMTFYSKCINHI